MSASQNLKVTWKTVPTRTIMAGGVELLVATAIVIARC